VKPTLHAVSARGFALFAAVSVVWGLPYLFIKIAVNGGFSPAGVAFVRVALAAAVLVPIALWRGGPRELRGRWPAVVAFALLEVCVPFPLIAFGEQHVASSLAAILVATLPLVIAVLALRLDPEERVTGPRFAGLAVGLVGVALLLGVDVAGDGKELLGAGAILVATVGYALGAMIVKRWLGDLEPLAPIAGSLLVASVVLAPAAVLNAPSRSPSAGTLGALAVLGLVCTALAFLLYFALIAEAGPTRAAVITYLNPVVAVALGVIFLGESVSAATAAGLALILVGSWVATGGRQPKPNRVAVEPKGFA
jgi:drug/metabolite transporter (DMT)-like permease